MGLSVTTPIYQKPVTRPITKKGPWRPFSKSDSAVQQMRITKAPGLKTIAKDSNSAPGDWDAKRRLKTALVKNAVSPQEEKLPPVLGRVFFSLKLMEIFRGNPE
jgi:hypothetical protein